MLTHVLNELTENESEFECTSSVSCVELVEPPSVNEENTRWTTVTEGSNITTSGKERDVNNDSSITVHETQFVQAKQMITAATTTTNLECKECNNMTHNTNVPVHNMTNEDWQERRSHRRALTKSFAANNYQSVPLSHALVWQPQAKHEELEQKNEKEEIEEEQLEYEEEHVYNNKKNYYWNKEDEVEGVDVKDEFDVSAIDNVFVPTETSALTLSPTSATLSAYNNNHINNNRMCKHVRTFEDAYLGSEREEYSEEGEEHTYNTIDNRYTYNNKSSEQNYEGDRKSTNLFFEPSPVLYTVNKNNNHTHNVTHDHNQQTIIKESTGEEPITESNVIEEEKNFTTINETITTANSVNDSNNNGHVVLEPQRKRLRLNLSINTSFANSPLEVCPNNNNNNNVNNNTAVNANNTNQIKKIEEQQEWEEEEYKQHQTRRLEPHLLEEEEVNETVEVKVEEDRQGANKDGSLLEPVPHRRILSLNVLPVQQQPICVTKTSNATESASERTPQSNVEEVNTNLAENVLITTTRTTTITENTSFKEAEQQNLEQVAYNVETTSQIAEPSMQRENVMYNQTIANTSLQLPHSSTMKFTVPYSPNSPFPSPSPMYVNSASSTPSLATKLHSQLRLRLPSTPIAIDFKSTLKHTVEEFYDKGPQIGSGTYGDVFVGIEKSTGRRVALKWLKTLKGLEGFPITSLREVIALKHIEKQRERLRLQQRQQLLCTTSTHTTELKTNETPQDVEQKELNITSEIDPLEEMITLRNVLLSGNSSHDIVLVFDYVGESVASLLSRQFAFSPPEVCYIFYKLINGIAKLHEMGIIHRDIKADNVLLSTNGAVQLADFGLCVFLTEDRNLTPSIINLAYRPPEMLLGSRRYDEKVDIWSIGCLLAQVFLHKPPFFACYLHQTNDKNSNNNNNNNNTTRHNSALQHMTTELQQLAHICNILGPLSLVDREAFSKSNWEHMKALQSLRQQYRNAPSKTRYSYHRPTGSTTTNNNNSNNSNSSSSSSNAENINNELNALFEESKYYRGYRGFRRWFADEMKRRELSSSRRRILLPSSECVEVLCAIFQLDPRKRPTAHELLQMPFFVNVIHNSNTTSSNINHYNSHVHHHHYHHHYSSSHDNYMGGYYTNRHTTQYGGNNYYNVSGLPYSNQNNSNTNNNNNNNNSSSSTYQFYNSLEIRTSSSASALPPPYYNRNNTVNYHHHRNDDNNNRNGNADTNVVEWQSRVRNRLSEKLRSFENYHVNSRK